MPTTVKHFKELLANLPDDALLCIDQAKEDEDGDIEVVNVDNIRVEPFENEKDLFLIWGE